MPQLFFVNSLFKFFIYVISAFWFAYMSGLCMNDDGLRHIAFAAHPDIMKSWGDVFPHSLFSTTYDPWYLWHFIVALYLKYFSYSTVHIMINATVLSIMMILLDRLIREEGMASEGILTILLVLCIVVLSTHRYTNLRPDALSGLYIMGMLAYARGRWGVAFILSVLYAPVYYLFFLYTGIMGLVYLISRDYKTFLAVLIASLIALGVHWNSGGMEFVHTVLYLLGDQGLREGLQVGEGKPLFEWLEMFNYYAFVAVSGIVILFVVKRHYDYFIRRQIALVLLIGSVLWLMQIRYYELFMPLILLYLVVESRKWITILFSRYVRYGLMRALHLLRSVKNNKLFVMIVLPYTIGMLGYSMHGEGIKSIELLEQKRFYADNRFNHKTVLLNSLGEDIYYALYQNPTIHFVPSCSIGWFENSNPHLKDIYIRMMKKEGISEKELKELMDYVGADYYIHQMRSSKQQLSFSSMETVCLYPIQIIDNKIIFEYRP